MVDRPLGRTGLQVSPIGFGAFKIGRNQNIKYPSQYDLPSDEEAAELLHGVLDLGINLIDTAPAYGISEQRIGQTLAGRHKEFTICTKVGETFDNGVSHYDFSSEAICNSVETSLRHLKREVLDIVLIHSNGEDLKIMYDTDAVITLQQLKLDGKIRAIGFSGKSVEGAEGALPWADVIMVTYNLEDQSHEDVITSAAKVEVGVLVKKGFGSGHLNPVDSIQFVLANPGVSSLIIGSLNLDHLKSNMQLASV